MTVFSVIPDCQATQKILRTPNIYIQQLTKKKKRITVFENFVILVSVEYFIKKGKEISIELVRYLDIFTSSIWEITKEVAELR